MKRLIIISGFQASPDEADRALAEQWLNQLVVEPGKVFRIVSAILLKPATVETYAMSLSRQEEEARAEREDGYQSECYIHLDQAETEKAQRLQARAHLAAPEWVKDLEGQSGRSITPRWTRPTKT